MKLHKSLANACILALFMVMSTSVFQHAFGQNDLVEYLNAGEKNAADGKEDAKALTSAYIKPIMVGATYGLNAAWFNTAKAHKTLGFDLGVYLSPVFIPKSSDTFTPDGLGLKTIETQTPGAKSSTILGPKETTTYRFKDDSAPPFQGPEGLGLRESIKVSGVVIPMIQLGIGVVKNTDLKIRYFPSTKFSSTRVRMVGFGVMHDIKQHIRGIKLLPFDLSILAGFTDLKGTTDLSGSDFKNGGDTGPQQAEYSVQSWLFQALISKKISLLTIYGGIGYSSAQSKSAVVGRYVLQQNPNLPPTIDFKDPISLKYKNNSARITGGFRVVLGVIFIDANCTLQEYSSYTVGLGVALR